MEQGTFVPLSWGSAPWPHSPSLFLNLLVGEATLVPFLYIKAVELNWKFPTFLGNLPWCYTAIGWDCYHQSMLLSLVPFTVLVLRVPFEQGVGEKVYTKTPMELKLNDHILSTYIVLFLISDAEVFFYFFELRENGLNPIRLGPPLLLYLIMLSLWILDFWSEIYFLCSLFF